MDSRFSREVSGLRAQEASGAVVAARAEPLNPKPQELWEAKLALECWELLLYPEGSGQLLGNEAKTQQVPRLCMRSWGFGGFAALALQGV